MAFPNLKNKHAIDSMIEPKEFINYLKKIRKTPKEKIPKNIIIIYSNKLINFIEKNHKNKKLKFGSGKLLLLKETNYKVGVIGSFGIGAPVAVAILEELIAFGVKKFISIGTAGSIQKHLKISDLVVCEKAIRDEGTSYHYLKHSKYSFPSKELTKKLESTLKEMNLNYLKGKTWTIDAPYRETVAEVRQYQKERVLTVEMEASALFAVAQKRKVQLASFFTISDYLAELKWIPEFNSKKTRIGLETLFQIALKTLQK